MVSGDFLENKSDPLIMSSGSIARQYIQYTVFKIFSSLTAQSKICKREKQYWGWSSVAELLCCMYKALGSIPSTFLFWWREKEKKERI